MNVKDLVYKQVERQLENKAEAERLIECSKDSIKYHEEQIEKIDKFVKEANEMFGFNL